MKHKIKRAKRSPHKKFFKIIPVSRFIVPTIFIALLLGLIYLGFNYQKSANTTKIENVDYLITSTPTNNPLPTISVITNFKVENYYDLTLPAGWSKTREEIQGTMATVYYADMNGNFLEIEINPYGRGFASDEIWLYELNSSGDGIKIVEEHKCSDSPYCPTGDKKFSIGIKNKNAYYIKNNHYFFFAGNTNSETGVDTNIYKNILESIIFK